MDLVERSGHEQQRRHPWETVRAGFFLRVLASAALPRAGARVLDVGAGDAWFASRLAERAGLTVTCWDTGYARHAPPADPCLRCTAGEPEGRFDLVLAMDVAEHVEDDRRFVGQLVARQLSPGGHLLFSVPAWPALSSEHDRRLSHVRRYRPAAARALLAGAGLRVVRSGGLFHSLILPRAIDVALDHSSAPHAGEWRGSAALTCAVESILAMDARASLAFSKLGVDVPGLSWWALCAKP